MSAPVATKTVAPLIPVTILTGFLGAGKTTLLKRILNEPHGEKIAVIENEFGEESIDNELLFEDTKERIVEMNNGCICCTVRGDLIRNRLPGHAGDRRLARGVNVRQYEHIRVLEFASKLIAQRLRALFSFRLEHREDALAPRAARGRERRADFARVMPVVIHDHEPLRTVLDLEPTARTTERFECLCDFWKWNTQLRRQRDHACRIAHVVASGDIQRERTERLAAPCCDEVRLEIFRMHILEPVVRARSRAV